MILKVVIRIHFCPWDLAGKNGCLSPKICHTLHTQVGRTFNTSHTPLRRHRTMSKNTFSRALGAGWGRDTNPVAHGLVVDRGDGTRQKKRQRRKTKVTRAAQIGNCAAESSVVPASPRCRDSWQLFCSVPGTDESVREHLSSPGDSD